MKTRVRSSFACWVLAASVAMVCAPVYAAEADGAESPEAAFAALQEAAKTRDTMAFTKLLEDRSRPGWVISLHNVVGKIIDGSDNPGATLEAWYRVADAHGFKADAEGWDSIAQEPQEAIEAYLDDFTQRLREQGATDYVAALLAFIDDSMKEQGYSSSFLGGIPTDPADGVDYVDEDRAIVRAKGEEYRFFRAKDSRWYYAPQAPVFD